MARFLGTYNPDEVSLNVGPLTITGFADGTFVTIANDDNELYKKHVGAKGEVSRTVNNNKMGFITFTLKSTSPSNKALDLLKLSPATFPVGLKNNSDSKYIAGGIDAWVDTDPDKEFGDEESTMEWVVCVPELVKSHI